MEMQECLLSDDLVRLLNLNSSCVPVSCAQNTPILHVHPYLQTRRADSCTPSWTPSFEMCHLYLCTGCLEVHCL